MRRKNTKEVQGYQNETGMDNFWTSKSDGRLISPYNITLESIVKVIGIVEMISRRPFAIVCLVAKPLIWSEAEGDLAMIETSI